jgi:hypothetical protein
MANKLTIAKRIQLLACLIEGNNLRSTARMKGTSVNKVMKFVADISRVKKNASEEKEAQGWGDALKWLSDIADLLDIAERPAA